MSPTPRAAALAVLVAIAALVLPGPAVGLGVLGVLAAIVVDARWVREEPDVRRSMPSTMSRGVASRVRIEVSDAHGGTSIRQAVPADLRLEPSVGGARLDAELTPRRRGRHVVPPVAVRRTGPLGLGSWFHQGCGAPAEVLVYPDLPAARRLAMAVRRGRFREAGRLSRGPMGLGTDFESIREYLPDDDVRQVNWRATARHGRPMSNQYRIEQDRDVICVIDSGRLMGAPTGEMTRLDAAVDAAAAMAFVADEVGDRCGVVAFDSEVRRRLRPRRSGGDAVVRAIFDLEPTRVDSDYELAFRAVRTSKRAFVLVLTDLLEESAARPLAEAIPLLARRHAVAVASIRDPELDALLSTPPSDPEAVYSQAAVVDVLEDRRRAAAMMGRAGADVIEAPPDAFSSACVGAYLRAKSRARL